ncbi:MAG: leucine-rich repeat protein [Eubacterium sp.]|nr:leucine-rich repeat protein [Eubacterium sp.]
MKKALSIILSLLMIISAISALPFEAFADELPSGDVPSAEVGVHEISIDTPGATYYEAFTAEEAAGGEEFNYEYNTYSREDGGAVITDYNGDKTDIVIPSQIDGYPVKAIGYYAFYENEDIKSVVIPEGVDTLDQGAFCSCSSLEEVTLPSTIKEIGSEAFYKCPKLTSIDLKNLEKLGDHALACSGFISMRFPATLTELSSPCYGCPSLEQITVDDDNPNYTDVDGVLFSKDLSILIQYPMGKEGPTYKVPDETKTIGWSAFEGVYDDDYGSAKIISVDLNNVSLIENDAFYNCKSLENIIATNVSLIENNAFYNCESLENIIATTELKEIKSSFNNCSNLSYVNYSGTKDQWQQISICSEYSSDNRNLRSATVFCSDGIINDKGIYYEGDYQYSLNSDKTEAYVKKYKGKSANVVIPDTLGGVPVTGISDESFKNNKTLTSIEFPDSVTFVSDWAFRECENIHSIKIGAGITDFDRWTFDDSKYITAISVSENNPVYDSRDNCNAIIETKTNTMIFGCGSTTIPSTVSRIEGAFNSCLSLTNITISSSVQEIDEYSFRNCSNLESISVDSANLKYDSRDNCNAIIETETNKLILGGKSTVIPNSVTTIGKYAFIGSVLESINIPSSVTKIEPGAFLYCTDLKDIYFWGTAKQWFETASYSYGGDYSDENEDNAVFFATIHCSDINLNEDEFKYAVNNSGKLYIYEYTGNASNVTVPATIGEVQVTEILKNTFKDNNTIENVVIPEGVERLGSYVFSNCENLKTITLPKSLNYIDYAREEDYDWDNGYWYSYYVGFIDNCPNLSEVYYNGTLNEAAAIRTYYTNVYLPSMTEKVIHCSDGDLNKGDFIYYVYNNNVFILECKKGITEVNIPSEIDGRPVSEIVYGFAFNKNTTSISIADGIKGIYSSLLSNTEFYKNESNWENGALYVSNYLVEVKEEAGEKYTVKEGTKSICSGAFDSAGNILTELTIPSSVISIDNYSFSGCQGLTDIYFAGSAMDWFNMYTDKVDEAVIHCSNADLYSPDNEFDYRYNTYYGGIIIEDCNSNKTDIVVPAKIADIDVYCLDFRYSNSTVKNMVVSEGVKEFYAIRNYSSLESVTIPHSIDNAFNSYAFENCNALKTITYNGTIEEWKNIAQYATSIKKSVTINCTDGKIEGCKHIWQDKEITENATCTKEGKKTVVCTVCGTTETQTIPKTDHTPAAAVKENEVKATYDKAGSYDEVVYCSVCGEELSRETKAIAKLKKTSLAKATVSGIKDKTYTGKALTQSITVKLGSKTLKKDTDYKVTYTNNKSVGKATLKITGINAYSGTISKTFKINPKGTTLSKVTAGSKSFTATWKKQATKTTGYEIQYATDSKFTKNKKSVTVSKNSTVKTTVKKLTAKKKYYVRIRTYKTISGTKYYSAWSASKTVTTKK